MTEYPTLATESLSDALRLAARTHPDAFTRYPGIDETLTTAELDTLATGYANHLRRTGVGRGDLVGLIHDTGPDFLICFFAALRAGAAVSVLPVPSRTADSDRVVERVERIIAASGIRHLIAGAGREHQAEALSLRQDLVVLRPEAEPETEPLTRLTPDDLAVVQFTSGTTGRPRGVMLNHSTVLAGLRAILVSAEFGPDDVFVQWIPTYHDMGLFGMLSQVLHGSPVHVFEPAAFLRDPTRVWRYLSEHGGTATTGPNFSYAMLADAVAKRGDHGPTLDKLRLAFNGAEPVRAATIEQVQEVLGPSGFRPQAMYPVYGMAEATLAVAFPRPGRLPRVVHAASDALGVGAGIRLAPEGTPQTKAVVSVGRPVHGLDLRIVDDAGEPLGELVVGEIQIAGDAVTPGYYQDPTTTAARFDGRWLRTGDLGFLLDDELFVAGRRSEMVIVYGRNYFPDDAEDVAAATPGVYRGHCAAFRVDGDDGEAMGIAVETDWPSIEHEKLRREVHRRVSDALGLGDVLVYPVPPGWITRTTSGKPQRLLAGRRIGQAG